MPLAVRRQFLECRACGVQAESEVHVLSEMMYGSRETFDYVLCSYCGCLQIAKVPGDLARHYPSDYYSLQPRQEPPAPTGLKGWLMRWYAQSAVLRPDDAVARAFRSVLPVPTAFLEIGDYLVEAGLTSRYARILDVGCGASPSRLAAMRRLGFSAAEGLDPYVPENLSYEGIPVYRRTIDQQPGEYDLIMFHHSLEHVTEPYIALREAARLLHPRGTCLVRIPVMGTYFWRHFGTDWVELDAPRHLQLLTVKSMDCLAKRVGLRVRKTAFDSEAWELAASTRYQRGIPLRSTPKPADGFSASELAAFSSKASELNAKADGGRACFYLVRDGA